MIIFLSILGLIGIFQHGISSTLPQVLIAVISCMIIDGIFEFVKNKKFAFSQSALISGLIISEVLAPNQKLYIPMLVSILAISSKHFINFDRRGSKSRLLVNRHVFNPANLGMFIAMLIFPSVSVSWWGGSNLILMAILGLFLAYRMKNIPLLIAFFVAHSVMAILYSLFLNPSLLVNYLLSANPYFAFFMLVEPMTSPKKIQGRVIYGILVALVGFLMLQIAPRYDHLISALVIVDGIVPLYINRVFK